jgi:hypothetical protein
MLPKRFLLHIYITISSALSALLNAYLLHHPLASCSGYIDLALVSSIQTSCHKVFAARLSGMHETLLEIGIKNIFQLYILLCT